MAFATKELTARTTFVPPSRFGPPLSPKQVPPLLLCSLMNSALSRSLLAINDVRANNRDAEAPSYFGPPPSTSPSTPYPTTSTRVLIASLFTRFCDGSAPYCPFVTLDGMGPQR